MTQETHAPAGSIGCPPASLSDVERQALYLRLTERLLAGLHLGAERAQFSRELLTRDRTLLQRACDDERQRGIAGHWTFDANRLIALRQAIELARMLSREA